MSLTRVRNAYAARAVEYIDLFGTIDAAAERDRERILAWARGVRGRIVDVGCGPGQWTSFLREHGMDVEGIDPVPAFIDEAGRRYPDDCYRIGRADDLGVEDAGGSVLVALAQGRFVDLSGAADSAEVPFEQHRVPVRTVTYHASEIRLKSLSEAVVGRLDLAGTLTWSGLSDLAGLPVGYGGEGRVLVTYTVDVLGLHALDVGISGIPQLDVAGQRVELTQSRIDVAGVEISESVSQQIIDRVVKPISLAAGDGVRVTGVSVAEGGLVAQLTATDVPVGR